MAPQNAVVVCNDPVQANRPVWVVPTCTPWRSALSCPAAPLQVIATQKKLANAPTETTMAFEPAPPTRPHRSEFATLDLLSKILSPADVTRPSNSRFAPSAQTDGAVIRTHTTAVPSFPFRSDAHAPV